MTTIETVRVDECDTESLLRHVGLYCRDLYELNGDSGPHLIRDEKSTVRWDPDADAAVFVLEVDGEPVTTTVPSSALDHVGLVVA